MAKQIREEDGLHAKWYDEARDISTPSDLAKFVKRIATDYRHDYGTICHAVAASAIAAAHCANKSAQGGITGFQASAIFWEFYQHWLGEKGPSRLQKMDDLLYPQMEHKFKAISEETWKWVREEADKKLAENRGSQTPAHPEVLSHWKKIAAGEIPFGLSLEQ